MFKLKVNSIVKSFSPADDKYFLDVECFILKDKKKVDERKLAFPLDITEKNLQNELAKYIAQYNQEQKMFVENKEKDRVAKQSDEVIKLMEGKEIE